jgi:hypothetical protein
MKFLITEGVSRDEIHEHPSTVLKNTLSHSRVFPWYVYLQEGQMSIVDYVWTGALFTDATKVSICHIKTCILTYRDI